MTLQIFKQFGQETPAEIICSIHKSFMVVAIDKIDSIDRNDIKSVATHHLDCPVHTRSPVINAAIFVSSKSLIMQKELLTEIDHTTTDLLETIASFKETQIDTVPFEGSWTAGQIAEHLSKAVSADVLYGNVTPTHRSPDEKSPAIRDMFLNFDIKMTAPDFVQPSAHVHNKKDILQHAAQTWANIREAVRQLDLSATCITFELPGFGLLTRLEWVRFMLYHTQRHIHQLKNIRGKV
jgi:hypothetical protein